MRGFTGNGGGGASDSGGVGGASVDRASVAQAVVDQVEEGASSPSSSWRHSGGGGGMLAVKPGVGAIPAPPGMGEPIPGVGGAKAALKQVGARIRVVFDHEDIKRRHHRHWQITSAFPWAVGYLWAE